MGRGPTNENTNMYFQARKKAATYNERLWSREGAAELLGMRDSLIEITADGKITKDELPALEKIIEQLEKTAEVISEMKIAGEKYLNGK